jgi:putative ABC transport system permease protein
MTAGVPGVTGNPVIELDQVRKVYQTGALEVEALRGISLRIDEGEYVAIMGPSGSGKSTLMHILGCLDVATSGRYLLAGEDVGGMNETELAETRNQRIGFVFQQFNLLPSLAAWRNVELPLCYGSVHRAERKARAVAVLERVGLGDRVQHRPGELSGGQQGRVALARALVTEPALILADEPTGNLDSKATNDVLNVFDELHRAGHTIVVITHEEDVAARAGRTVRLHDGEIMADTGATPGRTTGNAWPTADPAWTLPVPGAPVPTPLPAVAPRASQMNWLETLRTGLDAIISRRLRSGLTVLGILIGIAAVILTVGLGEGASSSVTAAINSLGSNLLVVTPGSTTTNGVRGGFGTASTLTIDDADALGDRTVAPDIAASAPTTSRSTTLTAGSSNWTSSVVGATPNWLQVRARSVSEGRFLNGQDVADETAVVVLGPTTAEQLFGSTNVVGQTVTVGSMPLTVVGVLAPAGSSSTAQNQDDTAIVPISTATNRLLGGANRRSVSTIYLEATSQDTLSAAYQEANQELSNLHHVTNPTAADFTITSQQSLLSTATSVSQTLTVLLGGIAAISLLVGGIGVMNIMLVSVTERIREIGLRKAIGASPRVIRRQFLVEASVLGLTGGVLGALVGIVGAITLPHVISQQIVVSPTATVGAIVTAMVIGVAFGVYPASRAARLAPIDALRSE